MDNTLSTVLNNLLVNMEKGEELAQKEAHERWMEQNYYGPQIADARMKREQEVATERDKTDYERRIAAYTDQATRGVEQRKWNEQRAKLYQHILDQRQAVVTAQINAMRSMWAAAQKNRGTVAPVTKDAIALAKGYGLLKASLDQINANATIQKQMKGLWRPELLQTLIARKDPGAISAKQIYEKARTELGKLMDPELKKSLWDMFEASLYTHGEKGVNPIAAAQREKNALVYGQRAAELDEKAKYAQYTNMDAYALEKQIKEMLDKLPTEEQQRKVYDEIMNRTDLTFPSYPSMQKAPAYAGYMKTDKGYTPIPSAGTPSTTQEKMLSKGPFKTMEEVENYFKDYKE